MLILHRYQWLNTCLPFKNLRMRILLPVGVDILVFHPCTFTRFPSLALGNLFLIFVLIAIVSQDGTSWGANGDTASELLQRTFVDFWRKDLKISNLNESVCSHASFINLPKRSYKCCHRELIEKNAIFRFFLQSIVLV